MNRLYVGSPYEEPEGFWKRVLWWLRQDYKRGEVWEREQRIRVQTARHIAADLREEFPPSDVPDYIERQFGRS